MIWFKSTTFWLTIPVGIAESTFRIALQTTLRASTQPFEVSLSNAQTRLCYRFKSGDLIRHFVHCFYCFYLGTAFLLKKLGWNVFLSHRQPAQRSIFGWNCVVTLISGERWRHLHYEGVQLLLVPFNFNDKYITLLFEVAKYCRYSHRHKGWHMRNMIRWRSLCVPFLHTTCTANRWSTCFIASAYRFEWCSRIMDGAAIFALEWFIGLGCDLK